MDKVYKILKNLNFFKYFNNLLFGRWIKSIKPSPHSMIQHRQNLLDWFLSVCNNTQREEAPSHFLTMGRTWPRSQTMRETTKWGIFRVGILNRGKLCIRLLDAVIYFRNTIQRGIAWDFVVRSCAKTPWGHGTSVTTQTCALSSPDSLRRRTIVGCSEQPSTDYELRITGAKTNLSFKWREKYSMFATFSTL
jgi:hypothetical protein